MHDCGKSVKAIYWLELMEIYYWINEWKNEVVDESERKMVYWAKKELKWMEKGRKEGRGLAWLIAVITAEPAIQYSFSFGIIQARLSGRYNACYLISFSFTCSRNNCKWQIFCFSFIFQRSFSLRAGSDKDHEFAKKYRILPTPIKIRPSKVRRTRRIIGSPYSSKLLSMRVLWKLIVGEFLIEDQGEGSYSIKKESQCHTTTFRKPHPLSVVLSSY